MYFFFEEIPLGHPKTIWAKNKTECLIYNNNSSLYRTKQKYNKSHVYVQMYSRGIDSKGRLINRPGQSFIQR